MDTIYTAVSALTIKPFIKLLPKIPFIGHFMSDKPKTSKNTPTLDGEKIKVPANHYADALPSDALTSAPAQAARNDDNDKPLARVSHVTHRDTVATTLDHQIA
jgi:hypothetical protein